MKKVFEGKIKQLNIVIRYLKKTDVVEMHRYINELSKEKTYITFQGEAITLDEERKYVNEQVEKIAGKESVILVVLNDTKLVGTTHLILGEKTDRHVAQFGITIAKEFRGKGIGKLLMKLTVDEGIKNMPDLEIVTLGVFSNNKLAYEMYKAFGFKEYGLLPNGVKLTDGYVDHAYMCKKVK